MNEIAVYIPNPDADGHRLALIDPGTALVGSPATAWFQRRDESCDVDGRGLILDYHAADRAVNIKTFCDRVMVAAERHRDHAPTHKRLLLADPEAVMHVGTYHFEFREVAVEASGLALIRLARWVGACGEDPTTLDSKALHAELRRSR